MKKTIILTALAMCMTLSFAQVSREGKTFKVAKTERSNNEVKTEYTYEYFSGDAQVSAPLYVNVKTGSVYIYKTSAKTGKLYKKYVEDSIKTAVCSEMGIQPKNGKK